MKSIIFSQNIASILILFLILPSSYIFCQNKSFVVEGVVIGSDNISSIPYANVRVHGTNIGMATNSEGKYRLILPSGNYIFIFTHIGYFSDTISIQNVNKDTVLNISLKEKTIETESVTIFGDDLNPAEEIIRRTIKRKRAVLSQLHSFEFNAYSKTILKIQDKNDAKIDTIIAGILETHTEGYWKIPNLYKEIFLTRKQTANFPEQMNIFTVGRIPNLNDDIVLIKDKQVIGPTAPNAFDYYSFEIIDTTTIDNINIWRIQIKPKSKIIPLFEGVISIADHSFLVVAIDVQGNYAMNSSPWSNINLSGRFALYNNQFWLPTQLLQSGDITISFGFVSSVVNIEQTSILYDYKINEEIPEELFSDQQLQSSLTIKIQTDSLQWSKNQTLPLSHKEMEAYYRIDSIMASPNFAQQIAVAITKLPLFIKDLPITDVSDYFHFNRVEGMYLGAGLRFNESVLSNTIFGVSGGYGFAEKVWKYQFRFELFLTHKENLSFGGEYYKRLKNRNDHFNSKYIFDQNINTLTCVFYKNDLNDYYLGTGYNIYLKAHPFTSTTANFQFFNEINSSVLQHSNYSFFNANRNYRFNPSIRDGRFQGTLFSISYDTRQFIDAGWITVVDKTQDSWDVDFQFEHTDTKYFKSDFDFERFLLNVHRREHTFGTNIINILFSLGYSINGIPPQRLFDLLSNTTGFSRLGMFQTISTNEFAGDTYAGLFIEYNIGTLLFRTISLPLVQDYDFILQSNIGWSIISPKSEVLQTITITPTKKAFVEAGFAIGKIFLFFRLDFMWRLTHQTKNNFTITIRSSLD